MMKHRKVYIISVFHHLFHDSSSDDPLKFKNEEKIRSITEVSHILPTIFNFRPTSDSANLKAWEEESKEYVTWNLILDKQDSESI